MNQFSTDTKSLNYIDRTAKLGRDVKVWHFAVILADVEIADDVSIGSRAEIGRGTKIGKGSRIGSGVFLPPNSLVGERVFIAPSVTCCDDRWPIAGNAEYEAKPPILMDRCSIGAGSVLLPGVRIGRGAMVGAGSVVTKDVPDGAVVRGEPARVRHMLNFDIYAPAIRDELMESHLQPV